MNPLDTRKLLKDESFLNFLLESNPVDSRHWKDWLERNPQYRDEVALLKKVVLISGDSTAQAEAEEQFTKLEAHISTRKGPIKRRLSTIFKYSIAALVTLAIGTVLYFTHKMDQQPLQTHTKTINILPGSNKALLVLADGRKINLDTVQNGIIAAEGGIKISKAANGQLRYGKPGSEEQIKIGTNTLEVPRGGKWQLTLPDGSLVWLNSASSITFPIRFSKKERKVKLTGEAYFEVTHNKGAPFKVESTGQYVEVLGTHFNVSAYPDEKNTRTTLLQGSVRVQTAAKFQLLKPGEQLKVQGKKTELLSDADLEEVLAWKNGEFIFNDDLETIMTTVSRWYNIEVVYQVKPNPGLIFTGRISRSRNISGILAMLSYNNDVHFKIEGRKVIVY